MEREVTVSNQSEVSLQDRIAGAVVLGLAMAFNPSRGPQHAAYLSLFDFGNVIRDAGFLNLLRLGVVLAVALAPRRRELFLLVVVSVAANFILSYTSIGAFAFSLATNAIVCFFLLKTDPLKRRPAVMLTFALIFILAAIQKINPSYLTGVEFTPKGYFLVYLFQWGLPADLLSSTELRALPYISIFVEFAVGFGLLLRPRIFAHVACLFALVLTLMNPYVFFVYGVCFPLAVLLDDEWAQRLGTNRLLRLLKEPFAWAFGFTFCFAVRTAELHTLFQIYPVLLALIVYHLIQLRIAVRLPSPQVHAHAWRELLCNPRFAVAPAIVLIAFFASLMGAPRPLGFSMFAGVPDKLPPHQMKIENADQCNTISRDWIFTPVIDAGLRRIDDQSCLVYFPTRSGLHGVKRLFCRHWPRASWIDASSEPRRETCESF